MSHYASIQSIDEPPLDGGDTRNQKVRSGCRVLTMLFAGFLLGYMFVPRYDTTDEDISVAGVTHFIQQPLNDDLLPKLHGQIVFPWMSSFPDACDEWNALAQRPLAVIEVADEKDVSETMVFMQSFPEVDLRIRNGGADYNGYSSVRNGVVLSLKRLNKVQVNRASGIVRTGGGALTEDVLAVLAPLGLNVPSVIVGKVGFVGSVLAGGVGYFARAIGLGSDAIRAARVVLFNGTVVEASEKANPELLWALRGAGTGSFGVVVELSIQATRGNDKQFFGKATFPMQHLSGVLGKLAEKASSVPNEACIVFKGGMGQPAISVFLAWYSADPITGSSQGRAFFETFFKPMLPEGSIIEYSIDSVYNRTRANLPDVGYYAGGFGGLVSADNTTSASIERVTRQITDVALEDVDHMLIDIELWGGAINSINPTATAFVHRRAQFNVAYLSLTRRMEDNAPRVWKGVLDKGKTLYSQIKPIFTGAYPGYRMLGVPTDEALKAYFLDNLNALRRIKREYDPMNRFRFPQSIPPA